ncbi:eukaryotic translation initiation factor 4E-2 isoform X1 [Cryptomeria japonica]|uniref:eukaryotic translation initiation factor 4E-2 isoform X1 n=1 Tax=Cryptomeria japonica TaxID=3369 RepID=UPI0025ABACC0|nr:eukaryotic translation initiation factor 4E-2 isoform X1 [Cryptomeria japonica]
MEDAAEIGEAGAEEGEIVEGGENIERSLEAADSNTHPLEHSWTFWFDNPNGKSKQAAWGSSLRSVYTFSTVEDFWRLYNNIVQPTKLMAGSDFHCFKDGIEPKWEDPKCANGGKWTVNNSKGKQALDTLWLNTLLAMIGEQFDEGDEICGAVVNVRNKQDKIALWTKNAANESAQMSIGKQLKEFLDYNEKMGYMFHDDAKKDRAAKNRYNIL